MTGLLEKPKKNGKRGYLKMNRPKLEDFYNQGKTYKVSESLLVAVNYFRALEKYCDELERKLEGEKFKEEWVRALCSDYQKLRDCRSELCLMCGNYKEEHKGACDGCKWKEWLLKDE